HAVKEKYCDNDKSESTVTLKAYFMSSEEATMRLQSLEIILEFVSGNVVPALAADTTSINGGGSNALSSILSLPRDKKKQRKGNSGTRSKSKANPRRKDEREGGNGKGTMTTACVGSTAKRLL